MELHPIDFRVKGVSTLDAMVSLTIMSVCMYLFLNLSFSDQANLKEKQFGSYSDFQYSGEIECFD